jgi:pantoate--beta-alanine ligase
MKVVQSLDEMRQTAESLRCHGERIGVVPTMGYLHEGHASLIRLTRGKSDCVITTIFVNPMQFAPGEDFSRYPRDLKRDIELAGPAGTDILFTPSAEDIYQQDFITEVYVQNLSSLLEGKFRPTHFRGVTTIVAKLFHLTKPHLAVFGQKDIQQSVIIKKMVKDLNFDVEIVVGPIVREPDGLAMSSRNVYLTESERKQSTVLYRALKQAEAGIHSGERSAETVIKKMTETISTQPAARIDYISVSDPLTLSDIPTLQRSSEIIVSLAVRFGSTRLIDNVVVAVP